MANRAMLNRIGSEIKKPSNKTVAGAGLGGTIGVLAIQGLESFGITVGPELASVIGTVAALIMAYFTPNKEA
jgi:hypothetical protein